MVFLLARYLGGGNSALWPLCHSPSSSWQCVFQHRSLLVWVFACGSPNSPSWHCAGQATCSDDEGLSVDSEDAASPSQLSDMNPNPAEASLAGAPEHTPGAAAPPGPGSAGPVGAKADPGGWLAYPQLYLGPPGPAGGEGPGPAAPMQANGSGAEDAEEPLSLQERYRRAARAVCSCRLQATSVRGRMA